jgi:hypothetical protein
MQENNIFRSLHLDRPLYNSNPHYVSPRKTVFIHTMRVDNIRVYGDLDNNCELPISGNELMIILVDREIKLGSDVRSVVY